MINELTNQSCPKCGGPISQDAPQGLCPKCVMSDVATEPGAAPVEIGTGDIPALERVAAAFPTLEIVELVGRGGMGFVFKARQPHLDRFVALKLLPDKLAEDPQFAERFNREGRVLARLSHPNIVSVYDFGRTNDFYFLMMEYVDGVNLRQAMRAGKFSPQEALSVVPTICEALQYAHDQGILHRDIKPENILLDTQGRVKIADFGIAKLVGEEAGVNVTLTNTGSALGTPHYMAPEQLETPSEVDHRADIYSLGVVLYEMLTGELPIGRFEPPSTKTPVGKGVDDVVFRALERNREKRQTSANEFKTQVETASTGELPPRLDSTPPAKPVRAGISLPGAIGAGLIGFSVVVLIIGGIVMASARNWVGIFELLIIGLPVGLAAVAGTILGWVGLVQIRRSHGVQYGTPLALFAAVAYPFGLPALFIIAIPTLTTFPAGEGPSLIARLVMFVLISGLLSALGWGVVAVARWADNRPRGEHWNMRGWLITTAVLSIGMFTLTLLALTDNKTRSGRSPAPIVSQISAAERLPVGVVELVALSSHPSDGNWWKPDGSPWTDEPFMNPGHNADSKADHRGVEMVFRTPGVNDPYPAYKFILVGTTGSSGGSMAIQNGEPVENSHFTAALFPKDLTETTVSVGVAYGDWETLADEESGSQPSLSMMRHGKPVNIKFVDANENANGDTVVTVAHDIENAQVQLVAVDAEGNEQRSTQSNTSGGHLTSTFKGMRLVDIDRFRLKTRPYRWATFENVQLAPYASRTVSGVRVTFDDVSLQEGDGLRRLKFEYTLDTTRAGLGWNTDGRFRNASVDLQEGAVVVSGARVDEPASYRHTASLAFPQDMETELVTATLNKARSRWQGNSLVVYPGDKFPIISLKQRKGNEVILSIVRRPMNDG